MGRTARMRETVKCKNCGIYWVRVIPMGDLELIVDLQYNCPKCGSNWYDPADDHTVQVKTGLYRKEVKP